MSIDQKTNKYPQLEELFSGEFHSEWNERHETEKAVIVEFSKYKKINELLDTLLEIQALKKAFPDDQMLKFVISRNLGLGYGLSLDYLKLTGEQWLDFVASVIKEELSKRQK